MTARAPLTIAICHPQIPFFRGGAEHLVESLRDELEDRGHEATLVSVPFRWYPRSEIGKSCLAWRMLDLSESNGRKIDLVIATKFPSYVVRHERKVTWLVHQFRQVYDLYGTPFSDLSASPDDQALREMVRGIDERTLPESRRIFTISRNVEDRLREWNGIESTTLHPPPRGRDRFRPGEYGRYVLGVGRFEPIKRFGPLVEALAHTDGDLRCVLVGEGPEASRLRELAGVCGVAARLEIRPRVGLDELVDLYAGCLAVYNAPYDEDYGLVTLEAFLSEKPVLTAPDSGGPLEFVEDGATGYVVEPAPEPIAGALRALHADRGLARTLGRAGAERARPVSWDAAIEALLAA